MTEEAAWRTIRDDAALRLNETVWGMRTPRHPEPSRADSNRARRARHAQPIGRLSSGLGPAQLHRDEIILHRLGDAMMVDEADFALPIPIILSSIERSRDASVEGPICRGEERLVPALSGTFCCESFRRLAELPKPRPKVAFGLSASGPVHLALVGRMPDVIPRVSLPNGDRKLHYGASANRPR